MGRIQGLEAARGIAALLVVWQHAALVGQQDGPVAHVFDMSFLAVDLFFLLSGFVLTRTFEKTMPGPVEFTRRRFVRLWPPIAIGVAVTALGLAVQGSDPVGIALGLATGLLMLPLIGGMILFNPPAWSIFFELLANACHAALLKRVGTPVLGLVVLASAAVLCLNMDEAGLDVGFQQWFWLGFPRVIMSYTAGVLLYRLNGERIWLPAGFAWPLLLAYPVVTALLPLSTPGVVQVAFVLTVHPLLLLALLSMRASRPALLLGAYSFPLYAVHYPVLFLAGRDAGMAWWSALVLALIAAALAGMVVDRRWRSMVRELLNPVAPANPAAEGLTGRESGRSAG